jgi:small-conductance mechanosensitive channel
MPDSSDILHRLYLGNTPEQWLGAAGLSLLVLLALLLVRKYIISRVVKFADGTRTQVGKFLHLVLGNIRLVFMVALAVLAGTALLDLPDSAMRIVRIFVIAAAAWQVLVWGQRTIGLSIDVFLSRRKGPDGGVDSSLATTMGAVKFIGTLALYIIVVLLAAENLGIDVKALLTGLGIGGIAVALALQNILGDLFASLSIVLDKPFVLGDYIVSGQQAGTVERIGLKTTRLRSVSGEQLVLSNSDLLSSRIQNFKRMAERRVLFTVPVTYNTPAEKLAAIPGIIQQAVAANQKARFDRAQFQKFGDTSLDFETSYFVLSADYNLYMEIQQNILLTIYRRFKEERIAFAFPARTPMVGDMGLPPAGTPGAGDGKPAGAGSPLSDNTSAPPTRDQRRPST